MHGKERNSHTHILMPHTRQPFHFLFLLLLPSSESFISFSPWSGMSSQSSSPLPALHCQMSCLEKDRERSLGSRSRFRVISLNLSGRFVVLRDMSDVSRLSL